MFTVLTTFPAHASGNVGDALICESFLRMLEANTGVRDIQVMFRTEDLTSRLDSINKSRAILMPGFAIREPLYPDCYAWAEDLDEIKVPLVPVGAGWKAFPGDEQDAASLEYAPETKKILKRIAAGVELFTTRDVYTEQVLSRSGVSNAKLAGDCAWYDLDSLGKEFRALRMEDIRTVVFTAPHYMLYNRQAQQVASFVAKRFPQAKRIATFHSRLNASDRILIPVLKGLGFEIRLVSHDPRLIDFYVGCDLHVGYRLHGHLAFLRKRIPSILINEDGRSRGCSATLKLANVDAFSRNLSAKEAQLVARVAGTRAFRMTDRAVNRLRAKLGKPGTLRPQVAVANEHVVDAIDAMLTQYLDNRFADYGKIRALFDETYQTTMQPFLRSLV